MRCDRCGEQIPAGDEMDSYGDTICEECYMQALSPARSCDPWAVHSAQRLSQLDERYAALSETQTRILKILAETGGVPSECVAQKLEMSQEELARELATLRHMERIRGEMRNGQKIICLWES